MTTDRRARWMLLAVVAALIAVAMPLVPVLWEKVWWRCDVTWDDLLAASGPTMREVRRTRLGIGSQHPGYYDLNVGAYGAIAFTLLPPNGVVCHKYSADGVLIEQKLGGAVHVVAPPFPYTPPFTKDQVLEKMRTWREGAMQRGWVPPEETQP